MLPSNRRLSTREFDEVLKKGRVLHSTLFTLRVLKLENAKKAKVSAVAPVKVAKKATERTKLRRQIYEAVKPLVNSLDQHINAIVLAKGAALTAEFKDIKVAVREIFVKAGVLK